jgi:transglutaminase-like putative cysteine protease
MFRRIQALAIFLVALGAARILLPWVGDASESRFDPWAHTARYEFEYRVELGKLPAGEVMRLWVPMPAETASQRILSTEIQSSWPYREVTDTFGNRIIFAERVNAAKVDGVDAGLVARFTVERSPSSGVPSSAFVARSGERLDPKRYLSAQRKIPLEGVIADIAARQSEGIDAEAEKIRAFYDYVYRTMTYAKHGEGWGKGDAIWACTEKYGNCTDFHSLFIGMARSQGIPARFLIGFPIPPDQTDGEIPGYHCWAEVYQSDLGWFPIDVSEAKKASRAADYYGKIPSDRIEFTAGRDLILAPAQEGEPVNYFIYPYVEIDGKRVENVPTRFHFKRSST